MNSQVFVERERKRKLEEWATEWRKILPLEASKALRGKLRIIEEKIPVKTLNYQLVKWKVPGFYRYCQTNTTCSYCQWKLISLRAQWSRAKIRRQFLIKLLLKSIEMAEESTALESISIWDNFSFYYSFNARSLRVAPTFCAIKCRFTLQQTFRSEAKSERKEKAI